MGNCTEVSTQGTFADFGTEFSAPDVKTRAECQTKLNGSFSYCW